MDIFCEKAPYGVLREWNTVLTSDAVQFVAELADEFKSRVEKLFLERKKIDLVLSECKGQIKPLVDIKVREGKWKVDPVPPKIQNRQVDLGDVSPVNLQHFTSALQADVQGIQVDFDDGHCPTWKNTVLGHYNLYNAVREQIPKMPKLSKAPALIIRPRAWNMTEYHMMVNGLAVPGPLFDFGLHMFHNARLLYSAGVGPYFYLSKLEAHTEAELWNDIFIYTQRKLLIPIGTIKACVLIENIYAAYQMELILYQLRQHSLGLNCGVWDYCASIIAKFGALSSCILPDRNKYVSIDKHFLQKYMTLAVSVCRRRGTVATGGMAAQMMETDEVATQVVAAKKKEIELGLSGFMVYDIRLVPHVNKLWTDSVPPKTPCSRGDYAKVRSNDLLRLPEGGVTMVGLRHNIRVAVLFIANWLDGAGHFQLDGVVEDSATAEISRLQVWQWLRHNVSVEKSNHTVNFTLVKSICDELCAIYAYVKFPVAIFLELTTLPQPPQFITTFLSDSYLMRDYSPAIACNL